MGWKGAVGALAVAHGYALGTAAYAGNFNDATAGAFANGSVFFRWGQVALRYLYWINLLWVVPLLLWWRVGKRRSAGSEL